MDVAGQNSAVSKSTSLALATLCLHVLVTAPCLADEPTQSPETYQPDTYPSSSARTNVLLAGAAVTAGSYGIAFGTSYLWSDAPTAQDLRLPVVGPVMAITGAKCGRDEIGCGTFTVVLRTIFATLSGIGQVGGLGVIAEGLFMKTRSDSAAPPPPPATSVYVSPMADDTALGFTLGGQF